MSTRLLVVDDSELALEYIPEVVTEQLGWEVATARCPHVLPEIVEGPAFDIALVDLSFRKCGAGPGTSRDCGLSGLDALLLIHEQLPTCHMVVFTQLDSSVEDMLRDAWEAFPLASAQSKTIPSRALLNALRTVERDGRAPVDPALQAHLPETRSPWRSPEGYRKLVHHAGHAKLWNALIQLDDEPSYKELAEYTGLSLAAVRLYRDEVLHDLALHHLDRPRMREMQRFAKRCRALLEPHIRSKLG